MVYQNIITPVYDKAEAWLFHAYYFYKKQLFILAAGNSLITSALNGSGFHVKFPHVSGYT